MNEKTKQDYIKLANNFIKIRLTDKGVDVTEKNIRQALVRSSATYRPAYWRRLRCALVAQQKEAGFSKTAKAIKEIVNPVTHINAPDKIKALKKPKQKRRKHVEKEEHFLLRNHLEGKKDFATLAAIEFGRILGCRPTEMLNIKLLGNNRVAIQGAKKREDGLRGLDRTIILSSNDYNTVSRHNTSFYDEANKQRRDPKRVMQRIQHRLTNATKSLWPKRQHQITLYSYRHQMGSDLKASGRSRQEIAAIMGHQSVDSVDVYGNKRRSSRNPDITATPASIASVRKTTLKNNNLIQNQPSKKTPPTPFPKFTF
jgi:integrase